MSQSAAYGGDAKSAETGAPGLPLRPPGSGVLRRLPLRADPPAPRGRDQGSSSVAGRNSHRAPSRDRGRSDGHRPSAPLHRHRTGRRCGARRPRVHRDGVLPGPVPGRPGPPRPLAHSGGTPDRHPALWGCRDRAPARHRAPRHQAGQRAHRPLPTPQAPRLRHCRTARRARRRRHVAALEPAGGGVPPLDPRRAVGRLLAGGHAMAPARGPLTVRDAGRRYPARSRCGAGSRTTRCPGSAGPTCRSRSNVFCSKPSARTPPHASSRRSPWPALQACAAGTGPALVEPEVPRTPIPRPTPPSRTAPRRRARAAPTPPTCCRPRSRPSPPPGA